MQAEVPHVDLRLQEEEGLALRLQLDALPRQPLPPRVLPVSNRAKKIEHPLEEVPPDVAQEVHPPVEQAPPHPLPRRVGARGANAGPSGRVARHLPLLRSEQDLPKVNVAEVLRAVLVYLLLPLAVRVLLPPANVPRVRQLNVVLVPLLRLLPRGVLRAGAPRQDDTQPLEPALQRLVFAGPQPPPLHLVFRLLPPLLVLVPGRPHRALLEHFRCDAEQVSLAWLKPQRRCLREFAPQWFLRVGVVLLVLALPLAGVMLDRVPRRRPLRPVLVRVFAAGPVGGPGLLVPGANVGNQPPEPT